MKKISFVLGLIFFAQMCSAGKYDSIFESRTKNVDIYIKYDPKTGFDIKMNGRQSHYDPKEIRNGYYRNGKLYSYTYGDKGYVWFERQQNENIYVNVVDYDGVQVNFDILYGDLLNISSVLSADESSVAIDAPNIVNDQKNCRFSKFYARVAEGGLFFNARKLIADNTAIFAENGFIYNSGYIGSENERSQFKIPSKNSCVSFNNFYESKIWKAMPGCIANVGTMAGQKINIQDLSLFRPGKVLCDDITIGDKKYDSQSCPSVELKPKIDPNLSQRIDNLNSIYKIPDETLNVIKRGYYKQSDDSWALLPYDRFESIIVDQKKIQINDDKEWHDIRNHSDTYGICNQTLLQAVESLGYTKRFIITDSKQSDLYNNTTLLASLPEGDHSNDFILSKNVHVIREDKKLTDDPFNIAVLTIPTVVYNKDSDKPDEIRDNARNRIRDIILMAAHYGYKDLVLDVPSLSCDIPDPFLVAQYLRDVLVKNGYYLPYCERVRFIIPGNDAKARYWRDAFRYVFLNTINYSRSHWDYNKAGWTYRCNDEAKYESYESRMREYKLEDYKFYIYLGNIIKERNECYYVVVEDEHGYQHLMATKENDCLDTLRDTTVPEKKAVLDFLNSKHEIKNVDQNGGYLSLHEKIAKGATYWRAEKYPTESPKKEIQKPQPQQAS